MQWKDISWMIFHNLNAVAAELLTSDSCGLRLCQGKDVAGRWCVTQGEEDALGKRKQRICGVA